MINNGKGAASPKTSNTFEEMYAGEAYHSKKSASQQASNAPILSSDALLSVTNNAPQLTSALPRVLSFLAGIELDPLSNALLGNVVGGGSPLGKSFQNMSTHHRAVEGKGLAYTYDDEIFGERLNSFVRKSELSPLTRQNTTSSPFTGNNKNEQNKRPSDDSSVAGFSTRGAPTPPIAPLRPSGGNVAPLRDRLPLSSPSPFPSPNRFSNAPMNPKDFTDLLTDYERSRLHGVTNTYNNEGSQLNSNNTNNIIISNEDAEAGIPPLSSSFLMGSAAAEYENARALALEHENRLERYRVRRETEWAYRAELEERSSKKTFAPTAEQISEAVKEERRIREAKSSSLIDERKREMEMKAMLEMPMLERIGLCLKRPQVAVKADEWGEGSTTKKKKNTRNAGCSGVNKNNNDHEALGIESEEVKRAREGDSSRSLQLVSLNSEEEDFSLMNAKRHGIGKDTRGGVARELLLLEKGEGAVTPPRRFGKLVLRDADDVNQKFEFNMTSKDLKRQMEALVAAGGNNLNNTVGRQQSSRNTVPDTTTANGEAEAEDAEKEREKDSSRDFRQSSPSPGNKSMEHFLEQRRRGRADGAGRGSPREEKAGGDDNDDYMGYGVPKRVYMAMTPYARKTLRERSQLKNSEPSFLLHRSDDRAAMFLPSLRSLRDHVASSTFSPSVSPSPFPSPSSRTKTSFGVVGGAKGTDEANNKTEEEVANYRDAIRGNTAHGHELGPPFPLTSLLPPLSPANRRNKSPTTILQEGASPPYITTSKLETRHQLLLADLDYMWSSPLPSSKSRQAPYRLAPLLPQQNKQTTTTATYDDTNQNDGALMGNNNAPTLEQHAGKSGGMTISIPSPRKTALALQTEPTGYTNSHRPPLQFETANKKTKEGESNRRDGCEKEKEGEGADQCFLSSDSATAFLWSFELEKIHKDAVEEVYDANASTSAAGLPHSRHANSRNLLLSSVPSTTMKKSPFMSSGPTVGENSSSPPSSLTLPLMPFLPSSLLHDDPLCQDSSDEDSLYGGRGGGTYTAAGEKGRSGRKNKRAPASVPPPPPRSPNHSRASAETRRFDSPRDTNTSADMTENGDMNEGLGKGTRVSHVFSHVNGIHKMMMTEATAGNGGMKKDSDPTLGTQRPSVAYNRRTTTETHSHGDADDDGEVFTIPEHLPSKNAMEIYEAQRMKSGESETKALREKLRGLVLEQHLADLKKSSNNPNGIGGLTALASSMREKMRNRKRQEGGGQVVHISSPSSFSLLPNQQPSLLNILNTRMGSKRTASSLTATGSQHQSTNKINSFASHRSDNAGLRQHHSGLGSLYGGSGGGGMGVRRKPYGPGRFTSWTEVPFVSAHAGFADELQLFRTNEESTNIPAQDLHLYGLYCWHQRMTILLRPVSQSAVNIYAGTAMVSAALCDRDGVPLIMSDDVPWETIAAHSSYECRVKGKSISVSLKSSPYAPIDGLIPVNPALGKAYLDAMKRARELEDQMLNANANILTLHLMRKREAQKAQAQSATAAFIRDIHVSLADSNKKCAEILEQYHTEVVSTTDKESVSKRYIEGLNNAQYLGTKQALWRGLEIYYNTLGVPDGVERITDEGPPCFYIKKDGRYYRYNERAFDIIPVAVGPAVEKLLKPVEVVSHRQFFVSPITKRIEEDPDSFLIGPDFDGLSYGQNIHYKNSQGDSVRRSEYTTADHIQFARERTEIILQEGMGLINPVDLEHVKDMRELTQWKQNHGYECHNTVKSQTLTPGAYVVITPTSSRLLNTFEEVIGFSRWAWLDGTPLLLSPNWRVALRNGLPCPLGEDICTPIVDDCGSQQFELDLETKISRGSVPSSMTIESLRESYVSMVQRAAKIIAEQAALAAAQSSGGGSSFSHHPTLAAHHGKASVAAIAANNSKKTAAAVLHSDVAYINDTYTRIRDKKEVAKSFFALRRWQLLPPLFRYDEEAAADSTATGGSNTTRKGLKSTTTTSNSSGVGIGGVPGLPAKNFTFQTQKQKRRELKRRVLLLHKKRARQQQQKGLAAAAAQAAEEEGSMRSLDTLLNADFPDKADGSNNKKGSSVCLKSTASSRSLGSSAVIVEDDLLLEEELLLGGGNNSNDLHNLEVAFDEDGNPYFLDDDENDEDDGDESETDATATAERTHRRGLGGSSILVDEEEDDGDSNDAFSDGGRRRQKSNKGGGGGDARTSKKHQLAITLRSSEEARDDFVIDEGFEEYRMRQVDYYAKLFLQQADLYDLLHPPSTSTAMGSLLSSSTPSHGNNSNRSGSPSSSASDNFILFLKSYIWPDEEDLSGITSDTFSTMADFL